jgi:hypothetical protein
MNRERLARHIENQHAPHLYCHVLVDPLAATDNGDHAVLAQLRSTLSEGALSCVYRADLAHASHLHPVLACLASPGAIPSRALLELTAQAARRGLYQRRRYLCGWLFSEAPSAAIVSHLAALCQIPDANRGFRFYPVYEPVRLELLAAAFAQAEQGPWWPVGNWLFLSSGGRLSNLKGQSGQRHPLPAPALRIQQDVALIEQVLCAWRALREGASALSLREIPPFAAVRASNFIDDARRLGLSTPHDIQVFALYHLCLHPRLHTAPAVRTMIDAAAKGERALMSMFAQYSDGQWQRTLDGLPKAEDRP